MIYFRYFKRLTIGLLVSIAVILIYYQLIAWLWREFKFAFVPCKQKIHHVHSDSSRPTNIGILLLATGELVEYVAEFVDSSRTFLLSSPCNNYKRAPKYKITYFIFSDRLDRLPGGDDIVPVFYRSPVDPQLEPIFKCSAYLNKSLHLLHNSESGKLDYLYSMDTHLRFVRPVGEEVIGELVATLHPYSYQQLELFNTFGNSSDALQQFNENQRYVGALFGGDVPSFFKACSEIQTSINNDLSNNVILGQDTESYLNNYFSFNRPTRILSALHSWPNDMEWNFAAKIITLRARNS